MKITPKSNNICRNPYTNHYFWENKIINHANLWEGYFENQSITNTSKIIYTGILNNEKNIFHYGFAAYPSIPTLLGFLQNVFFPTAFFTWFDCNYDDFYIPLAPYEAVVSEVINDTEDIELNSVNSMNNLYYSLNNILLFDDFLLNLSLNIFCEKFNSQWDNDYNKKIFIKVFDSPSDVFDFIKNSIGWADSNEFVEEEISMDLDKLKFTCDNAIREPLLNRKFIDILNINIPPLF